MIKELRNGKQDKLAFLFEKYSKKIYGLAFRMCGNSEDAEDIVQMTFVQAITYIGGFKEESSIYTWLYSIAKNLCIKLLNEKKKSSFSDLEKLLTLAKSTENSEAFTSLEKQYYINQVKEGCLLGLLRCLSFYQRVAFILNVIMELSIRDVAVVIGKSENATRVLIHRAKQNLKNFMCRNCSLYDENNTCRCENLIHFSLKQGWVQRISDEGIIPKCNNTVIKIENEINSLKKVVRIYNSLKEQQASESSLRLLKEEIQKKSYEIFFEKKVK